MIVERHTAIDLFEFLPELRPEMDPELTQLDVFLEDDELFARVKDALCQRYPNSANLGRSSTPVRVVLRMLVVNVFTTSVTNRPNASSPTPLLCVDSAASTSSPPPTTPPLIRWANVIGADTIEELNERVVGLARSLKVTRGWKLRTDGTVVETNIHHPTDSGLIADGVRVLGRLVREAKAVVDATVRAAAPGERFRDRSRCAKRLNNKIARLGRRLRSDAARGAYQETYEKLLKVARTSVEQAEQLVELLSETPRDGEKKAIALREDIEHFCGLLSRVVSQTERRLFVGESVPAAEKLVSIFEPHTEIIRRGKSSKPTEFGRKVWLSEVEGGIVSSYRVLDGNPSDAEQIETELERHLRLFGAPPRLRAADRGCYSPENERLVEELGVERICLPKRGSRTEERRRHERQRWVKRSQRFRAGSEGRISVLTRRGQLGRCRDHGEEGFGRWVGWGILAGNLSTIAHQQVNERSSR